MVNRQLDVRQRYDLAIVGGGIYGCSLLWEAARRGVSAILLEKDDFCSQTSANTLKVIHSGIRYLQSMNLRRVRESVVERDTLMCLAPHLVRPLPCLMPTTRSLTRSRTVMAAAFRAFDLIHAAGRHAPARLRRNHTISRRECLRRVPWLGSEAGLTGAALWHDGQVVSPERLGLEFVLTAQALGAHAYNHAEVEHLHLEQGGGAEVVVRDTLNGQRVNVPARAVVLTAGSGAARLLSQWRDASTTCEHFVRGVNIVADRQLGPLAVGRAAAGGDDSSHRLLFAAPWEGRTIIGTWYFANGSVTHSGGSGPPRISESELALCLADIASTFPGGPLRREEISLIHTGLLPAGRGGARDGALLPSDRERIFRVPLGAARSRVFYVSGVKYTTARRVAEKTLRLATSDLDVGTPVRPPWETPLCGGGIHDFEQFVHDKKREYEHLAAAAAIERLAGLYGTRMEEIMTIASAEQSLCQPIPGCPDVMRAELRFVLETEQALTVCDAIIRRTGIGARGRPRPEAAEYFAEVMGRHLGWDEALKRKNVAALEDYYVRLDVSGTLPAPPAEGGCFQ